MWTCFSLETQGEGAVAQGLARVASLAMEEGCGKSRPSMGGGLN